MWEHPRNIYQEAYKNGYAVGTFNISNVETLKGILHAAEELHSPVMIATSKGEGDFIDPQLAVAMVKIMAEKFTIPVGLHLDHGKTFEEISAAIDAGYLSVHIDASDKSFDENLSLTKKVVEYCTHEDVNVEGEIGHVGGSSSLNKGTIDAVITEGGLTNPEQAWQYAQESGIDQLAIAIGNAHGVYEGVPHIEFELLEQINQKVKKPLVLHGGSGIPEDQIRKAVTMGIAKVNINTEVRMAFSNTLREILTKESDLVVPYKIFPPVIEAVTEIVKQKIEMFGSANRV